MRNESKQLGQILDSREVNIASLEINPDFYRWVIEGACWRANSEQGQHEKLGEK